jgi:hypothetical protein
MDSEEQCEENTHNQRDIAANPRYEIASETVQQLSS